MIEVIYTKNWTVSKLSLNNLFFDIINDKNIFIPFIINPSNGSIMRYISIFLLITTSLYATIPIVEDPFRWLEDDKSSNTIEWLARQDAKADAYFQDTPVRAQINDRLKSLFYFDMMSVPEKKGDNLYFLCRKKDQTQPALYTMNADRETKILIDPMTYDDAGTAAITGYAIHPEESLVAFGLSFCGSDWEEWRIKNLQTGEDLDILTGIKLSAPTWDATGTGLYYFGYEKTQLKEDPFSTSRCLYYHRLGTHETEDTIVFSQCMEGFVYDNPILCNNGQYLLFSVTEGANFLNKIMYADLKKDPFNFVELLPLGTSTYSYIAYEEGRLYFAEIGATSNGRIISIDPNSPQTDNWLEIIPEGESMIEQASFSGKNIVVSYLKNACSEIKIFNLQGQLQQVIPLPGLGTTTCRWRGWKISGNKNDPEFFFSYTDFITPKRIFFCHSDTGEIREFSTPEVAINLEGYHFKQVFYPSKDGTLIPLFIIHKKDLIMDGNVPTLLYGYGGFGLSMTPLFDPRIVAWLELGGVYAMANIRGGGEYGEKWHLAGMRANKQNVFDDFISAAEWLTVNGYTNPAKLAITGRSNGGLLVGACITQRPDLFKAAIVGVAVLDMLRFHKFTLGWAWVVEYGSPDQEQDFHILYSYSPYHQVKKGISYPSTLITTANHDDRVVPLHSYKFAAALQDSQAGSNPVLLKVYKDAGHGAGKSINQVVEEDLNELQFLVQELMED